MENRTLRLVVSIAALFVISGANIAATYEKNLAELTRGLPARVHDFIDRRANCNHWLGEEPYDAERKVQIQSALGRLRCAKLEKDEFALKVRFSKNRAVLRALEISKDWTPG